MGTQNQDPNRQPLGKVGKKTPPQDPAINPERDDDAGNQIEQSTSDEGLGRDDSPEESGAKSGSSSGTARHSER